MQRITSESSRCRSSRIGKTCYSVRPAIQEVPGQRIHQVQLEEPILLLVEELRARYQQQPPPPVVNGIHEKRKQSIAAGRIPMNGSSRSYARMQLLEHADRLLQQFRQLEKGISLSADQRRCHMIKHEAF